MTTASTVESTLHRAWQRRLLVLTVDQSALALAVIFGSFALLILLGTQILAWPWLLVLAASGITLTIFGIRRRLADTYTVAQMLDQHLSLNDSLSTAWFLSQQAAETSHPAASFQLQHAEQLAQTADLAAAFPFERRRSWLITGALCLLAVGLFSARYLVTRDLSLQHPFLPLALTQVFEYVRNAATPASPNPQSASSKGPKAVPPGVFGQEAPRPPQSRKPEPGQNPSQPQAKGATSATHGSQSPDPSAEQSKSSESQTGDAKPNASADGSKPGVNTESGKSNPGESQSSDPKQQQDGGSQQKSESMLDRMRDALSSVMTKIKPAGAQESQSGSQKSSEGQKSSDKGDSKDQSGEGEKEAGKEQSAQEQSSGQQQGQGAAKAQSSGKDSAQASDKKGSDAQSGVGHSDGDKEVKAAEQAKAMGKLAEIIGKRSASLTGDMQVEPSGKQRLQTGYTHQQAQHTDAGGEINRDEVPVEDQEYVREYMELVRKAARKTPAPPTTSH